MFVESWKIKNSVNFQKLSFDKKTKFWKTVAIVPDAVGCKP